MRRVAKRAACPRFLVPEIPKVAISSGKCRLFMDALKVSRASIIGFLPTRTAAPLSARYSLLRENQKTTIDARLASNISVSIVVTQKPTP
jgi:hypothetical protein